MKTFTINNTNSAITFRFATPFQGPLFLGLMSINLSSNPGVTGTISPGRDASHGGSANLQMDSSHFGGILNFVNGHPGQDLFMQLVFEGLTPLDVIPSAIQPQIAVAP
ncbi:MAG TPA: hypothetical protein VFK05_20660 [Polyangiaceae bacterium]|nr:hypothetical protein [Polyangiaceae bacterium]